jgi:predicted nucleotidyltransferase component of viral defense system
MSGADLRALAQSVHQRLLNRRDRTGEDFNVLLVRYAIERLLYRLYVSPHSDRFVLKGAMLFEVWTDSHYRTTRDLDLLGLGVPDSDTLRTIFGQVCTQEVEPDGMTYDVSSILVTDIRDDQKYQGHRVELEGRLGNARISIQIDVGFGDIVIPQPQTITFPVLLDGPAPKIRAYTPETTVAEKLHAVVTLGIRNSRMKDFFDLVVISRTMTFEGTVLARAIKATFEKRGDQVPREEPFAFTNEFARDITKQRQWAAFVNRGNLEFTTNFEEVIEEIRRFVLTPLRIAATSEAFDKSWGPKGPWQG